MKISTLRKSPSGDLGVKDKNMTFRSGFNIMSLKSKFVGNKQPQTPR